MKVPSLAVGETVEVVYRNPDAGHVAVDLVTEEGNIALNVNPRYDSYDMKTLVLNSLENGTWDMEIRPPGFPFPANSVSTRVTIGITALEECFLILANGITISEFPYRRSLTNDKVRMVKWAVINTAVGLHQAVLESNFVSKLSELYGGKLRLATCTR